MLWPQSNKLLFQLCSDERSDMFKHVCIFCLRWWSLKKTSEPFTSLYVVPVSAAYSQALLQGPRLGPFVLTNVTTCKLFLARKSSLGGLIFGLVSPLAGHTRARAPAPPPPLPSPSLAGRPMLVRYKPGMTLARPTTRAEDREAFDRLMGWAQG